MNIPVAPARHVHWSGMVHFWQAQPMHSYPSATAIQSDGCRAAAHRQELLVIARPLELPTDGWLGSQIQHPEQNRRAVLA